MTTTLKQEDDGRGTPKDMEQEEVFHDVNNDQNGFLPTLSGPEWREMHILLEITYKSTTEATTSPKKHLALLHEMYQSFPKDELIIYDNKSRKINRETCEKWTDIEAYQACFNIHDGYGRHIVIFRIRATQRFGTIKRDKGVWKKLLDTGCYLKRHHWPEDKWQITTLGFICLMDPSRHQGDDVREHIIKLAKKEKCHQKNGEKFKLIAERFKFQHKGTNATHAFGIQCLKEDTTAVDDLMKGVYRENKTYVKNKLKKAHKDAYVKAMILQNVYLTKVNTVVLVGITRLMMEHLRPLLLQVEVIDYVAATTKTDTIGRWDIICVDATHNQIIELLNENLDEWLEISGDKSERPLTFPEPGVQTQTNQSDEDSSEGGVSYLSSSAGSYEIAAENYDSNLFREDPSSRMFSGVSWAQVASRNPQGSTASSQPKSEVSGLTTQNQATNNKTYDDMEKRLNDKISSLTDQMKQLVANGERMQTLMESMTTNKQQIHHPHQGESNMHHAGYEHFHGDPRGGQNNNSNNHFAWQRNHHQPPYGGQQQPWHQYPNPTSYRANRATPSESGRTTPPRRGSTRQTKDSNQGETNGGRGSSAKRKTTGEESKDDHSRDLNIPSESNPSFADNAKTDRSNDHDDKRKDQRETPQKKTMTQDMIIRTKTPPNGVNQYPNHPNPYHRPPMAPTHMPQPMQVYDWGRPSHEVYGPYARSEAPVYNPEQQQPRQYEHQPPFDYDDGFYSQSLADHEMENAQHTQSRPAEDAGPSN